jgi:hypothetical protein
MVNWIAGAWRRAVRNISELPLWEVLRRRDTRKLAGRNERALAFAVERCTTCPHPEECIRLLAAGQDEKIEAFCPNAMYLRHLDAMERHARKEEPKQDLL